jgi:putative acyl-CoA dehydrogenase
MLPRLYREAPVNAIWEGSGNVMGLDVLRAFARDGDAARDVLARVAAEVGDLPGGREAASAVTRLLSEGDAQARAATERLALIAAAAALKASAPQEICEAFATSRLARPHATYGAGETRLPARLIARALPG